jgi:hypothetical protein
MCWLSGVHRELSTVVPTWMLGIMLNCPESSIFVLFGMFQADLFDSSRRPIHLKPITSMIMSNPFPGIGIAQIYRNA